MRTEAMKHLLQFPSGDLVSCDNWASLKEAVGNALMDTDTHIAVSHVLTIIIDRASAAGKATLSLCPLRFVVYASE